MTASGPDPQSGDRVSRRSILGVAVMGALGAMAYGLSRPFQRPRWSKSRADAPGVLSRGLEMHRQGNYERAAREFAAVIRSQPDLVEAYLFRGIALANAGDHQAAIEDFSTVLRLRPEGPVVYLYRGDSYLALGFDGPAAGDYRRAAAEADDNRIKVAAQAKLLKISRQE